MNYINSVVIGLWTWRCQLHCSVCIETFGLFEWVYPTDWGCCIFQARLTRFRKIASFSFDEILGFRQLETNLAILFRVFFLNKCEYVVSSGLFSFKVASILLRKFNVTVFQLFNLNELCDEYRIYRIYLAAVIRLSCAQLWELTSSCAAVIYF